MPLLQRAVELTLNLDCPQIGSGWNEYFNFWPVILFHAVMLGPPRVRSCLAKKENLTATQKRAVRKRVEKLSSTTMVNDSKASLYKI